MKHARRRAPSKPLQVLLVVITIAAGAVASRAEGWWPPTAPIIRSGTADGEPVAADPVWLTVHGARAGTVLADGLEELDTGGAWVAVDITVEAMSEPSTVGEFVVRDDRGREFRQADRVANPMVNRGYDPGVPQRGDVVFEVPDDALSDLVVVISPASPGRTIPRAIAEVPVQVGDVSGDPLEVGPPQLVSP